MNNTKRVNGYIKAIINDSISLSYKLAKDYKAFPQILSNSDSGFTSTKFAGLIMLLEKDVFGYSKFKITDYENIFKDNAGVYNHNAPFLVQIENGASNVVTTMTVCYTVQSGHCNCYRDDGSCDMCMEYCAWELCLDYDVELGGGPIGGGGGPIGGGGPAAGDGGGGSGGIPYDPPPCNPNPPINPNIVANNVVPGGPLPPCPPPGGGPGWEPLPPIITNDPCDPYISTLQNDNNFSAKFRELGTYLTLPHEMGYEVQERENNIYSSLLSGNATSYGGSVNFPNQVDINGVIHSHFRGIGEMFSPGDIISIAKTFLKNEARDKANLFMGVATEGGNYLIKVTDTAKFRLLANKVAGSEEKELKFRSKYNDKFNFMNNAYANEKGFLQMFDDFRIGGGMTLYRDDEDCKKWKALSLRTNANGTNTIDENNCY